MRILIAYASKNGTVEKCVARLCEQLRGMEIDAVNLEKGFADPSNYDMVVFGSSVYFGRLRRVARSFLKNHESVLLKKPLALFLCCGLTEESEYYLEKLFPQSLREAAFQILYFGGSLSTEGLSFLDRLLVRSIRSSLYEANLDNGDYIAPSLPGILPENIDRLATYLRKEACRLNNQTQKR
ncbi:MAG: flavodoxin domain-containing protein [Clostridia bacterium]|nr:flavodoxin domain-containing protein [Clostridia bacterium]